MPDTRRFRYLDIAPRGAGRPRGTLVLIHAFPLNARMFEPQFALADEGWRIVAPQLRQFDNGAGERPASTVDDYAGDVIDLLDHLKIDEAVIGGVSMGGYVTMAIARHAPRYISGLVLADTRPQADTPEGVEGRKKMIAMIGEKGAGAAAAVADDMLPKLLGETTRREQPEIVERVRGLILSSPASAIEGAVRALMSRPDSAEVLNTIHRPALVLVGAEDTITPPALSRDMAALIGGAELVTIERAGHLANLEQPARFNEALARFLGHRV